MEVYKADVAIVGAGSAALRAAIAAAESDPALKIALISRVHPMRSQTVATEGGAAAVTRADDSLDYHFDDTVHGGERTWFAADKTGFHMLHTLFQTSIQYPSIMPFDEHFCSDLMVEDGRWQGVVAIQMATGEFTLMQAKAVIIAAGEKAEAEEREQQGAGNG